MLSAPQRFKQERSRAQRRAAQPRAGRSLPAARLSLSEGRPPALRMAHRHGRDTVHIPGTSADRIKSGGDESEEATPDMRQRALGAGARFLISKPFTPESRRSPAPRHGSISKSVSA